MLPIEPPAGQTRQALWPLVPKWPTANGQSGVHLFFWGCWAWQNLCPCGTYPLFNIGVNGPRNARISPRFRPQVAGPAPRWATVVAFVSQGHGPANKAKYTAGMRVQCRGICMARAYRRPPQGRGCCPRYPPRKFGPPKGVLWPGPEGGKSKHHHANAQLKFTESSTRHGIAYVGRGPSRDCPRSPP